MPTVVVDRDALFERLGRRYTDAEFDELCFEFGVELDDAEEDPTTKRVQYAIALPANRTDLLCIEGFARALRCFLGTEQPPAYAVVPPASRAPLVMHVKSSTASIRPYVVCAVLRGVTFTQARYDSFIDLQDKLHHNIARRRTLVAIGTHDLDTLQGPFSYEALPPAEIEFVPLSQAKPFRGDALIDFYRTDPSVKHIKPYVDIIAHSPVYPIIFDAKRTVLSLPPLINGEHSKIGLATRNVFIECTATDLTKAHLVLNTVVAMFSEYCDARFTVEPVQVIYEEAPPLVSGDGYTTPDLSPRRASATMAAIRGVTGVPTITAEAAAVLASKMQLGATPAADGASIDVLVPPTRPDVLHECDIVEDVAIAYGYNNLPTALPTTQASGSQLPINKLTDALRHELARAGYDECLTFALVSRDDNYGRMLLPDPTAPVVPGTPGGSAAAAVAAAPAPPGSAVVLANPKTEEFQIGRTALVPGLLKSLASNRAASLRDGLKLFEVSDVMLVDPSTDTGARNERRAAALYTGPTAGYEVIHGLVDRLMMLLEVPRRAFAWERAAGSGDASPAVTASDGFGRGGLRYYVEPEPGVPSYFPGRGARVVLESRAGGSVVAGTFGVLHPRVLAAFELAFPVSVVELNVEHFL